MFKAFQKIGAVFQNSRIRLIAILLGIVGLGAVLVGVAHLFSGPSNSGSSTLAGVPNSIQSVPGSQLSQAYLKTLLQSNQNQAQQALQSGGSAIPTIAASPDTIQTQNIGADTVAASLAAPAPQGNACALQSCCCCGCSGTSNLIDRLGLPSTVANQLKALGNQGLSAADYAARLQQMVAAGELTQDQANQLIAAYKPKGSTAGGNHLIKQMEANGEISAAAADQLTALAQQGLSRAAYAAQLNKLVAAGVISPEVARRLLAAYQPGGQDTSGASSNLVGQMLSSGQISQATADQLNRLANSGLTPLQYGNRLAEMVAAGEITPSQAQQLLSDYMATHPAAAVKGEAAQLQQAQEQQQLQALQAQFASAALQSAQADATARAQETTAMVQAMGAQINQLLPSWEASPQVLVSAQQTPGEDAGAAGAGGGGNGAGGGIPNAPLIKLGTILFAVLDTAVNSDRPSPVMATIVAGPYKGAKLIGSLQVTPDRQRVILTFTNMTMPDWPDAVPINALAINPDTAQVAIASHVNQHYLLRYGSLFAASFLQGYATAVTNSGQTTVSSNGTTTQTYGNLSPTNKIMVGLGQVGSNMAANANNLYNTPPTITVNAGVGVGMLFTQSVPKPAFWDRLKHRSEGDGQ